MIVACELGMHGGAHGPFNAGLLATVRAAFPSEEVVFAGTPAHMAEVQKQLGSSLAASVSWKAIPAPGPGVAYARRFFQEMKIIWNLSRTLRPHAQRQLLLTSTYPSTVIAAKLATRLRVRNTRVQAVLHGGLTGVGRKRHRHPIRRFQEMRTALTLFGNSRIQYVVLEDSIREALLRDLPALAGRVEVLEHPLAPNESEAAPNDLTLPIRFGFLGLADDAKGFPTFTNLAREIAPSCRSQAEFHVIGRLRPEAQLTPALDVLATRPGHERLRRADFVQGVRQLHFIVLPHQAANYEMGATGTLLDAIAWEKPVIARRIPIFENMFQRYGNIGYLFDDDKDLRVIVRSILSRPLSSHYRNQILNIRKIQADRMPAALAVHYREICNRAKTGLVIAPLESEISGEGTVEVR